MDGQFGFEDLCIPIFKSSNLTNTIYGDIQRPLFSSSRHLSLQLRIKSLETSQFQEMNYIQKDFNSF